MWLDGGLVDADQARVSVFDHGLTVGDGVFETLRAYGGRPFALRRHLERLATSAAGLGLAVPPADVLRSALTDVLAANGLLDAALRVTVTGGAGPLSSARAVTGPTVIVAAAEVPAWPDTADVVVVPWPRNDRGALAGLKTTSYAENVVALAWALERGADEALFLNLSGHVCEGTATNVFAGLGGRLVTPPLASGCLAGVTRALVVEACGAAEQHLSVEDLAGAEEAFLTSTTREVQPIRAIDGTVLPDAPGPLTRAAAQALGTFVSTDADP